MFSKNRFLKHFFSKYILSDESINVGAHIRNSWIAKKAAGIKPGTRILDAGAGECQYRNLFAHCDYKTQDFSEYMGTSSGTQKETWVYGKIDYVSDICSIPVQDSSFDVILCTEVLEHIPKPIDAFHELSRILTPGGTLLITAPLSCGLHQQPFHFYGGFTPGFYKKFLAEAGMEIVEMIPIGGLLKHVGQELYRTGRLIDEKKNDNFSPFKKFILMYWLPNYLYRLEKDIFIEEFTIGYLVEARKLKR